MKKFLIFCLVVLVLLLSGVYFLGGIVLRRVSDEMLVRLPPLAEHIGIEVTEPSYEKAYLSSLRSATWDGVSVRLHLKANNTIAGKDSQYLLIAGSMRVSLMDFSFKRVLVELNDFSLNPSDDPSQVVTVANAPLPEELIPGRVAGEYVRAVVQIQDVYDPKGSLRWFLDQLANLVRDGQTEMPIDVDGSLTFQLGGKLRQAAIRTEAVESAWRLMLNPSDLKLVSEFFDDALTDAEIEVVAKFPLRAGTLLTLKENAQKESRRARDSDHTAPEDAYRHVLWSYSLTKTYGPSFARQVTDAHEVGAKDNTEADHRMDYHNNKIGRQYAQRGVREQDILLKVKTDPQVIRRPE